MPQCLRPRQPSAAPHRRAPEQKKLDVVTTLATKSLPKGRRQRLAETVSRLGAIRLLKPFHDRNRRSLLVLAYHRIAQVEDERSYPLDVDLISATPEGFAWQMAALREHMTPVSLTKFADVLASGEPLPPRAVAVTFDDGFCDTYEHAFPVLRAYDIPATIFVSTDHVESGEPFWFEFAAHLMLRVPPGALRVETHPEALPSGTSIEARRHGITILHKLLKAYPNEKRTALTRQWAEQFGHLVDHRVRELSGSISRDQILEMADGGIEFGSHTVTHPNLALASDEQLDLELRSSKAVLEQRLGRAVRTLAYPFGVPGTYDHRVMARARSAGYSLAVSYRQGVNWPESIEPFDLRRIAIGPSITRRHFETLTALPAWFRSSLAHIPC